MLDIDPSRLDLAREFKARPFGVHSPDLQAVLNRMRSAPVQGKHYLIMTRSHAQWVLARMTGDPLRLEVVPGFVFDRLEEAEWTVFKLRWQALTGHDLGRELGEPAAGPAPAVAVPTAERAILAYADEAGVAPGETIGFKVSCHGVTAYRADIVRLLAPDTGPDAPGFREEEVATPVSGEHRGRVQPLHVGSSVTVPASPLFALASFTLQALVWPTRPGKGAQALLGTWSEATRAGAGLALDERGALTLRLGDGSRVEVVTTGVPLAERRWYFVAASFDAASRAVHLWQEPVADRTFGVAGALHVERSVTIAPRPAPGPFLMAAWQAGGREGRAPTGAHFNGKLDRPRVANRALTRAEIGALVEGPRPVGLETAVVAEWDFAADIGSERVTDRSPNRLHGETVNLPARAMTGHNWTGAEMDWTTGARAVRRHPLPRRRPLRRRLARRTSRSTVPAGLRSGVYAAATAGRAAVPTSGSSFFVRPPRGAATAARPVAFLASTATYLAYSNYRGRMRPGARTELFIGRCTVDGRRPTAADARTRSWASRPTTSHSDGSGVCHVSRLRPIVNIRPTGRLWNFVPRFLFCSTGWKRTGSRLRRHHRRRSARRGPVAARRLPGRAHRLPSRVRLAADAGRARRLPRPGRAADVHGRQRLLLAGVVSPRRTRG